MYWNLSRKSNLSISSSDGKQCLRYGKICCYRRKVWCDRNSKISGRELALGIILSALQEYVSLNKHGRQWETLSECCCHRKAWAASAQSFTLWQQATMEITRRDHSIIACLCHKIWVLIFMHILFVVNHTFNCRLHIQRQPTGCNSTKKEKMIALQNSADVWISKSHNTDDIMINKNNKRDMSWTSIWTKEWNWSVSMEQAIFCSIFCCGWASPILVG